MQIDKTGQPPSEEDLQEAIKCVETIIVKHPLVLPMFTLQAVTIRNCLLELQEIRKQLVEYGINFEERK